MKDAFDDAIQAYANTTFGEGLRYVIGYAVVIKMQPADMSDKTCYTYVVPDDQTVDVSVGLATMLDREVDGWLDQEQEE